MLRFTLTFDKVNEVPHAGSRRNPAGFTLLELLIVLAVAGIMSAMAIPSDLVRSEEFNILVS